MIFSEATEVVEPGKGAFYDAAFWQHFEAMRGAALHHLNGPVEPRLGLADELAGITAVDAYGGHRGKGSEQAHQHGARTDPILDTRRMYAHREQPAWCIDGDVRLAAFGLLART